MARSVLEFDDDKKFSVEIEYAGARSQNVENDLKKIAPNNEEFYNTWVNDDEVYTYTKKNVKYGGEVASPILRNNKKSLEDLKTVLKILKKHRACSDSNQSLQVRISSDIFEENVLYLYNFLKIYLAYEDIIYKFGFNGSVPRDSLMTFSRPCDYTLKNILRPNLTDISYYSIVSLLNNILFSKQHGLSFYDRDNKSKPSSVEFRMFNTTFNYNNIINAINLCMSIVLSSKNDDLDMDLVDYRLDNLSKRRRTKEDYVELKEEKAHEFSDLIFKKEETKDSFIKQYTLK